MNSDRVCVDASLALTWLLASQANKSANVLRQEWYEKGVELTGPPIFHAEVTSVLRGEVFFKRLLPEEGEEVFSIYLDIPIRTVDKPEIYWRAWQLAKEFNLPVCYDMCYLAVAELENCELWTLDRRLVNAVRGNKRVKWVGDYIKKTL